MPEHRGAQPPKLCIGKSFLSMGHDFPQTHRYPSSLTSLQYVLQHLSRPCDHTYFGRITDITWEVRRRGISGKAPVILLSPSSVRESQQSAGLMVTDALQAGTADLMNQRNCLEVQDLHLLRRDP